MRSSTHHSFDVNLATELGSVDLAIIVQHFQFWITKNKKAKRNYKNGSFWTYQTLQDLQDTFPYWNSNKIRDLLDLLCNGRTKRMGKVKMKPIMKRGNYNQTAYDRTLWYAFRVEADWIKIDNRIQKDDTICDMSQMEEGYATNRAATCHKPIPDTIPDTEQDTTTDQKVVVIPDFLTALKSLHIDRAKQLAKDYEIEQLKMAFTMMQRSKETVDNPYGWIKNCIDMGWEERPDKETMTGDNKRLLRDCFAGMEGKMLGPYKASVGTDYIAFDAGGNSKQQLFKCSMSGFELAVRTFIKKVQDST